MLTTDIALAGSPRLVDADAVSHFDGHTYAAFTMADDSGARPGAAVILRRRFLGKWQEVFRANLPPSYVLIEDRVRRVNLRQGFRRLAAGRLPGRSADALYAPLVSLDGSVILESKDGISFNPVANPSPAGRLPPVGDMVALAGRLFAIPAHPLVPPSNRPTRTADADVFVSGPGGLGDWIAAAPPGFGDGGNLYVSQIAVLDGHLYAGTVNPTAGFQLWRTDGAGPPFEWTRVLGDGAHRFTLNKGITAMAAHRDRLLVAAAALGPELLDVGDRGPEIIAVDANGDWEIVVGAPRFTPDGYKRPLSGVAAGFGDPSDAAFTRMQSIGERFIVVRLDPYMQGPNGSSGSYAGMGDVWISEDGTAWRRASETVAAEDSAEGEAVMSAAALA